MERIRKLLLPKLVGPALQVYGEWLPGQKLQTDVSGIYVFALESDTEEFLVNFIQNELFDGGIECDQETFYISLGGISRFVYPPGD